MRRMQLTGWRATLCAGLVLLPGVSLAWDGTSTLVPETIDVTDGANYGFRVWGPTCGGVANFAYLLPTDSNYNAYVALILMGKATGSQTTFFTTKDANGYCHLGYVSQG
jgi:hypothetical protein